MATPPKKTKKDEEEKHEAYLSKRMLKLGPRIGAGTQGAIYEVTDETDANTFYVIKMYDHKQKGASEAAAAERAVYRSLKHEHVISLKECLIKDEFEYFVLPRYNEDLRTFLSTKQNNRIPESEAKIIFKALCDGMLELHKQGFTHGDPKAENVLLGRKTQGLEEKGKKLNDIKWSDFGFAKKFPCKDGLECVCETKNGTVEYCSPHNLLSKKTYPTADDVFALGTMMFEVVHGRLPFLGSAKDILDKKKTRKIDWDKEITVSKNFVSLIRLMLNPDHYDRIDIRDVVSHAWFQEPTEGRQPPPRPTPPGTGGRGDGGSESSEEFDSDDDNGSGSDRRETNETGSGVTNNTRNQTTNKSTSAMSIVSHDVDNRYRHTSINPHLRHHILPSANHLPVSSDNMTFTDDDKPESNQVVTRLQQIREYIKQTSSLMDALKVSKDSRHTAQYNKLSKMLLDLRDSEQKLEGALVTLQKYDHSEELLEDQENSQIQQEIPTSQGPRSTPRGSKGSVGYSKTEMSVVNSARGEGESSTGVLKSSDSATRNELRIKVEESQRKLQALQEQQADLLSLQQKAQHQLNEARATQVSVTDEKTNKLIPFVGRGFRRVGLIEGANPTGKVFLNVGSKEQDLKDRKKIYMIGEVIFVQSLELTVKVSHDEKKLLIDKPQPLAFAYNKYTLESDGMIGPKVSVTDEKTNKLIPFVGRGFRRVGLIEGANPTGKVFLNVGSKEQDLKDRKKIYMIGEVIFVQSLELTVKVSHDEKKLLIDKPQPLAFAYNKYTLESDGMIGPKVSVTDEKTNKLIPFVGRGFRRVGLIEGANPTGKVFLNVGSKEQDLKDRKKIYMIREVIFVQSLELTVKVSHDEKKLLIDKPQPLAFAYNKYTLESDGMIGPKLRTSSVGNYDAVWLGKDSSAMQLETLYREARAMAVL